MEATRTHSSHSDTDCVTARPAWFLVQTRAKQAERAEEHLARQNYQVFLPRLPVEKITRGKRVQVTEPLFPGYLFLQLCPGIDNWQPVRSTRGVLRLVSFGGQPLPVSDDLIEAIRTRTADMHQPAGPVFATGEKVRIAHGPFADLDAVFQCFDGEERVVVLLHIMQREQKIRLSLQDVTKTFDNSPLLPQSGCR